MDNVKKIISIIRELKIKINNFNLYKIAFTHPSVDNDEHNNYQKLEFIGDAILGSIISVLIYKLKPSFDEGQLTHLKIFLVNTNFLSKLSLKYNFQDCIISKNNNIKKSKKVLADIFESFIGAFYLDNSYDKTEKLIKRIFEKWIINFNYKKSIDFKTRIQEIFQKNYCITYALIESKLIEDNKMKFEVELYIDGVFFSSAVSTSKDNAEQEVSQKALKFKRV